MNVKQRYAEYLSKGYPKKDAAKLAQQETGVSLVSGRPINKDKPLKHETRRGLYGREYISK
jgi:hypothetical protein